MKTVKQLAEETFGKTKDGKGLVTLDDAIKFAEMAVELAWRDAHIQAIQEDRDHQYEMKVKARDQRDAVTAKLKKAQAENIRLLRNFINPNSAVFTTHCVPEDFQGD